MQAKQVDGHLVMKEPEVANYANSKKSLISSQIAPRMSDCKVDVYDAQQIKNKVSEPNNNCPLDAFTAHKKTKKPPIYRASEIGNVQKLRRSLKKGEDPNRFCPDQAYSWPLFAACVFGHVDCARLLLEHGAEPNIVDTCGSSPLTYAVMAWREDPEICKLLLKHGASIDARYGPKSTIAQRFRIREKEDEEYLKQFSTEKSKMIKDIINSRLADLEKNVKNS